MSYDMFLFFGHGEGDNGAVGNGYTELELVRCLTLNCVTLLENKGVKVLTNVKNGFNNYNRNLTSGQEIKYKMGATLHLNSATDTSANGSEIIVPCKEKYLNIEEEILEGYKKIGFNIRGIKSRDYSSEKFLIRENGSIVNYTNYYKEIRNAWDNGYSLSIIETCFISNKNDVNLFIKNIDKIAKIIVNPYLKEMGKETYKIEETIKTETSQSDKIYRVICGSFKDKSNAEKRVKELKNKGFESFIM